MSCLFSPPNLLTIGTKPTKRLGVNGGMDASVLCIRYNPPNYPIAKIQLFFQTKEEKGNKMMRQAHFVHYLDVFYLSSG